MYVGTRIKYIHVQETEFRVLCTVCGVHGNSVSIWAEIHPELHSDGPWQDASNFCQTENGIDISGHGKACLTPRASLYHAEKWDYIRKRRCANSTAVLLTSSMFRASLLLLVSCLVDNINCPNEGSNILRITENEVRDILQNVVCILVESGRSPKEIVAMFA